MKTAVSFTLSLLAALFLAGCGNDSFVDDDRPAVTSVTLSQGDSIAFDCPVEGFKGAGIYTKGLMTVGMAYDAGGNPVYKLPLNEEHYLDRPRVERIRMAEFDADGFLCRFRLESAGRFSVKVEECRGPEPVRVAFTLDYELARRDYLFMVEP